MATGAVAVAIVAVVVARWAEAPEKEKEVPGALTREEREKEKASGREIPAVMSTALPVKERARDRRKALLGVRDPAKGPRSMTVMIPVPSISPTLSQDRHHATGKSVLNTLVTR